MAIVSLPIATGGLLALLAGLLLNRALTYRKTIRLLNNFPGYRRTGVAKKLSHAFTPVMLQGVDDNIALRKAKHTDFVRFGWEAIASCTWFNPSARIFVADPAIIKQICASRLLFPKPTYMYRYLEIYGTSVVTTDGPSWSRHRKIVAPAFAESNMTLAYEQTVRLVKEMLDADWGIQGERVVLPDVDTVFTELTLLVILGAGFGYSESWSADGSTPEGHTMTFRDAIKGILKGMFVKALLPDWVWGTAETRQNMQVGGPAGNGWFGPSVKRTAVAYSEVGRYMHEMIREQSTAPGRVDGLAVKRRETRDLFSNLVTALGEEVDGVNWTTEDVFGNTFLVLIAGHNTTAQTLSFAFGLLALEPDEQAKLYAHLKEVLGDRELSYADLTRLDRVLATLNETLRLYAPFNGVPKGCTQDAYFMVDAALSEEEVADPNMEEKRSRKAALFIPKGAEVILFSEALHYNPRYWPDPYAFKPERFLKAEWPRDAFLPFSAGSRGCIGRRFAEIEGIVAMTHILLRYQVSVDSSRFPDVPGESKLQRRERFLQLGSFLMKPSGKIPLVFTKR